eukprot:gene40737-50402_t
MAKMTALQVAALKPRDKPYKQNVDTGLQLRIAANGVKTWIIQYVVGGRQRELRLSRPYGLATDEGHLSLADARSEAARVRALARDGIDTQVQQEEARAAAEMAKSAEAAMQADQLAKAEMEGKTVQDMFDAWISDGVRRKDRNAELKRSFTTGVLPHIGSVKVRDIDEHQIRGVLRKLVDRDVNRAAVILRNDLTQMFAWARKRQPWRKLLVDGDPMELIEIEKIVAPDFDMDGFRDRVLSDAEVTELHGILVRRQAEYDAAPNKRVVPQPLEPMTQRAIWIMLSTLTRVGETSMARWEHVDLRTGEWFIPKTNVKGNVSDLTIYLSDFTLEQFKRLHTLTGHTAWCFPSRNDAAHVDVKSFTKQIGDRQCMFRRNKDGTPRVPMKNRVHDDTLVLAGGKTGPWTSHDLRRTGATMMQRLGVTLAVIDRCQNHVLTGSKVRRHYLHHDYATEKREAWHLLGKHLFELTA